MLFNTSAERRDFRPVQDEVRMKRSYNTIGLHWQSLLVGQTESVSRSVGLVGHESGRGFNTFKESLTIFVYLKRRYT